MKPDAPISRGMLFSMVILAAAGICTRAAAQNHDLTAKSSSFADQIPQVDLTPVNLAPASLVPDTTGFAPAPVPNLDLNAPVLAQNQNAHIDPHLFHKTPPDAAGNFVYQTSHADRIEADQQPAAGLNLSIPVY